MQKQTQTLPSETRARSASEVFDDYLDRADRGDVEGDIMTNYAPNCVLLTTYGRFEGIDGVRAAAALLEQQVPKAVYEYTQRAVHGDIAFLEWTAKGRDATVRDGADTFLIRDGRVQVMTIHYTVERAHGRSASVAASNTEDRKNASRTR